MPFGIVICMFWANHNPPHFHAYYGGDEALNSLNGDVLKGALLKRA